MSEKLAVITGASSGIGKTYAYKYASMKYNLLLIARREELLTSICKDISGKFNVKADYMILELASDDERKKLYSLISSLNIDVLINNAGFGLPDDFENIDESIKMLKVHDEAAIGLTYAALKSMIKNNSGAIINVASIAGFLISPKNALYCASKAFLISFSESLHIRLKKYNIKVQALCPGFTHTDFHEKIGYAKDDPVFKKFMTSDEVVDISLKYLAKDKVICIPGFKYKFAKFISHALPRNLFYNFVAKYSEKIK